MRIMKNTIKKDIYLSKKGKEKLLIIWYLNNSIIMEYQKIINLSENTPNQPTTFRTKNWIQINDNARGT